jgi:membrane associated rhomboid family serine protease
VAATSETAGVAYMAHIGGFVAGLVLVKLMALPRMTLAATGRV